MLRSNRMIQMRFLGAALSPLLWICAPAGAEAQQRAVVGIGEVTANDVYVRSGPSTNHYTICKLAAGERVKIVSERGDWYEILPPPGTYSLISGEYVDTADGKAGVVNGNNVRVRAGSQLNTNKYTVQTMLSKGAEVAIVGSEPDGFLRIDPPPAATLWISKSLVEFVPDDLVKMQRETQGLTVDERADRTAADPVVAERSAATAAETDATAESPGKSVPMMEDSTFEGMPPTAQRLELERIDKEVRSQLEKPAPERRLGEQLEKYRSLAVQNEDELARRYAELRCAQIEGMIETSDAVRRLRERGEVAEAARREYMSRRMSLPKLLPAAPEALDATGELRESALYSPGQHGQRYRLIDPNGPAARTIGYVEIPEASDIDAQGLLGRYVGVRAAATRLQSGGVDPIPIYVARELILVTPPGRQSDADESD